MVVERLYLAVPWGYLRFVIVVFPDHTHLLFFKDYKFYENILIYMLNSTSDMLDWDNEEITVVLEDYYKSVVPLFGKDYVVPNKGTTILYLFRSLLTVLSSTENGVIQELSKL